MSASITSPLSRAKAVLTVINVAAVIYPGWKAAKSCHSPFREDRHSSFSVYDEGRKWKDFSTGDGGDVVDFIVKARGCDKSEAARELILIAGTSDKQSESRGKLVLPAHARELMVPVASPRMSAESRATWDEGVAYLLGSDLTQRAIDGWRCWTPGTTRQLAEDYLMACPVYGAKRVTAFTVQCPYIDELTFVSTQVIGYHARLKPRVGERASWRYDPSGIPGLPFVLGGGFVPFAGTIIVTEGQWDAITLASAAGWLASDAAWPERIAVFGTRGADGWRQLIDAWAEYWPESARFILFPDNDGPGAKWTADGGFREKLVQAGHHVRTLRSLDASAKDLNDLHRAQPITPAVVNDWLA